MSDIWQTTIVNHKEIMLFKSVDTQRFYWLSFKNEYDIKNPEINIFEVLYSQPFLTEEAAHDAYHNGILTWTLQQSF